MMRLKNIFPVKSNGEKIIQVSQIFLNMAVILALSPLVCTALEDGIKKASGWPECLRSAVWKFLSEENE